MTAKYWVIALCLTLLSTAATAQERASGQANDAQVNWSTLSDQFNQVDTQNKALSTTVEAIINCNKQGKMWNGTTCVDPAAIANITNCGNSGKTWNGSSCVSPYQLGNVTSCANQGKVWNGSYCVNPYQLGNITNCAWDGKVWNGSYCQNPAGSTSCRMCVQVVPFGDGSQCSPGTHCTDYSSNNSLKATDMIMDDTDNRGGGCLYFYQIQCQ